VRTDRVAAGPECPAADLSPAPRQPLTLVIPCFNEELVLPYLAKTLQSVDAVLAEYDLDFVFVDDGSTDGTWSVLQVLFGNRPNCRLLRHPSNRGVAQSILTGVEHARAETVCSIDCDCSYDPHQLRALVPMLKEGVDLATASPYHRLGMVRNVPSWRLMLSKGLSFLYRRVLHHELATYTSCFRVYRRSALQGLSLSEGGFLGVAEMLGRMDLRGAKIVECPCVLEVRLFGRSKMKVVRTCFGHLRLLGRLVIQRAWSALAGARSGRGSDGAAPAAGAGEPTARVQPGVPSAEK
jgi:glycosyltransferase involved in cell wall biosynthesis